MIKVGWKTIFEVFFFVKISKIALKFHFFTISGEYNGGYISDSQSLAGSRKSLAMPGGMPSVMMIPQFQVPQPPPTPGGTLPPPEQYSDGQTPSGIPPPYGSYSQMQNFQL